MLMLWLWKWFSNNKKQINHGSNLNPSLDRKNDTFTVPHYGSLEFCFLGVYLGPSPQHEGFHRRFWHNGAVFELENRATIQCPACDVKNAHWKIVDDLIKKHNELVSSISLKTDTLFNDETDAKDPDDDDNVDDVLK